MSKTEPEGGKRREKENGIGGERKIKKGKKESEEGRKNNKKGVEGRKYDSEKRRKLKK